MKHYGVYIDGAWQESVEGSRMTSFNPAREEAWYTIASSSASDVDRAVRAARRAFDGDEWRRMSPQARGRLVKQIASVVEANADLLAEVESIDCGKVLSETKRFVQSCADHFRFFGELADKITGDTFVPPQAGIFASTRRVPIGVVAAIVPWNNPLWLLSLKLGPALAAGNTVVIKPSEICAAPVIELIRCIAEAIDLPKGVINLVTGAGDPCGSALVSHADISRVAFTGGPETARHIVRQTAGNLAEVSLELGGKSPALVFDDADLDNAAASIVSGVFLGSAGQSCVASSRVLVQEGIYEAFVDRIVSRAGALIVGDPLDSASQLGPLATQAQLDRIERAVADAAKRGCRVLHGGRRPAQPATGWYYQPTIIECPDNADEVMQTEWFGPVLGVIRFKDEAEAIRLANGTRYGLAAGVFTRDLGRAHRLVDSLRAGIQYVNCYRMGSPMGPIGGFGDSGKSRENGIDAVRDYTKPVTVWINTQV